MEFTFSKYQHLLLHQTKHLAGCDFLLQLFLNSWTLAVPEVSWKGGSQSSPGDRCEHPGACYFPGPCTQPLSLPQRAGPMQTCPGHAGAGWLQPFTKLTFTNTYILNLLSVPHYKESLQCRIWAIHCFDVLIGLLHSLWNNFGWSGRWMSMLLSGNHESTLDKKYQTERACFLLWQYYQRLAAWAQTELQQQKTYLYIFQNYALVT